MDNYQEKVAKGWVYRRCDTIHPQSYQVDFRKLAEEVEAVIEKFTSNGWSDFVVEMESTMDPYDDVPGPVEITISGWRERTPEEEARHKKELEQKQKAKKTGMTLYEVALVERLQREGKL